MKNNDNNTGDYNIGDYNTGYRNTGDCNTGDCNTGNWNTGDYNTGCYNTGDCNTGNRNTGDYNTGYRNTGDCNTGDWNTGNWNTGAFNTDEPNARLFNKDSGSKLCDIDFPDFCYFTLNEWVAENNMTSQEKADHPEYKTTGGYLKTYNYKEAFKKSWDNAPEEDRKKIFDLPNFDAEIFKEISGIDVYEDDDLRRKKAELIKKLLAQAEQL